MPKTKSISFPADADTQRQLEYLALNSRPKRSRADIIREAILEKFVRAKTYESNQIQSRAKELLDSRK